MGNLIATCMRAKDKEVCPQGVTRCSLKRCVGCTWSMIDKKRVSKAEIEKLKGMAKMFNDCKSKPDTSDLVLVEVKEMNRG